MKHIKLLLLWNSKTPIVTKLKTQNVTKLKLWQKSITQNVTKLKLWQNLKTQIMTKLKISNSNKTQNSNFDKTLIMRNLDLWKEKKTLKLSFSKNTWYLDNQWEVLGAAFFKSCGVGCKQ